MSSTPNAIETRNLGLPVFDCDGTGDLDLPAPCFAQCRVPVQDSRSITLLAALGFYQVEICLTASATLEKLGRYIDRRRTLPRPGVVDFRCVAPGDERTWLAIKRIAGRCFTADRFHIDDACPNEVADRRFVNWVGDLRRDPAVSTLLVHLDGEIAGFYSRKGAALVLAGLKPRHTGKGLGRLLYLETFADARSSGEAGLWTTFSGNNMPVLNLYASLGFRFSDPKATLHRWRR